MATKEAADQTVEDDPPEQEKDHHNGFISSGDELEPEPVEVIEDTVDLVIVDPNAVVSFSAESPVL